MGVLENPRDHLARRVQRSDESHCLFLEENAQSLLLWMWAWLIAPPPCPGLSFPSSRCWLRCGASGILLLGLSPLLHPTQPPVPSRREMVTEATQAGDYGIASSARSPATVLRDLGIRTPSRMPLQPLSVWDPYSSLGRIQFAAFPVCHLPLRVCAPVLSRLHCVRLQAGRCPPAAPLTYPVPHPPRNTETWNKTHRRVQHLRQRFMTQPASNIPAPEQRAAGG